MKYILLAWTLVSCATNVNRTEVISEQECSYRMGTSCKGLMRTSKLGPNKW